MNTFLCNLTIRRVGHKQYQKVDCINICLRLNPSRIKRFSHKDLIINQERPASEYLELGVCIGNYCAEIQGVFILYLLITEVKGAIYTS